MLWVMLSQPLRAPHAQQQLQKQTDFDAAVVDGFLLGKMQPLMLVSASAEKAHAHRAELAVAAL